MSLWVIEEEKSKKGWLVSCNSLTVAPEQSQHLYSTDPPRFVRRDQISTPMGSTPRGMVIVRRGRQGYSVVREPSIAGFTASSTADYRQPLAEVQLRELAAQFGEDFDSLLARASGHFRERLQPRGTPLTDDDIRLLFEDDQRAL